MVAVVCFDVGLTTLSKVAMDKGMSHFVFVVYSNTLDTLILLPSSSIFHMTKRYPLTLSLLCRFFTPALIGLKFCTTFCWHGITLLQNSVFTVINYSSPNLGSALNNLTPAFTFILKKQMFSRMEKLDIRSTRSRIKVTGTLVSISGALIVLYIKVLQLASVSLGSSILKGSLTSNHWVLGGLFLAIAYVSSSIWKIFQAATMIMYPVEMIIVSFNSFFATIQCLVVSLIAEKNPNVWRLTPNLEFVVILYSHGSFFKGVVTPSLQTWCLHKKSSVFVAMFTPVGIAVAAIMGVIFLGDTLHLGSLVGATIIVLGFYGVIWGYSKETRGS
ncbi:hypothetical protein MKX03_036981 [Papaver bracteatum]|nr:hypothetical protein MKX03_036981 [Papaver bracteatum]